MKKIFAAFAVIAALAQPVLAQTTPLPTMEITHAWARATAASARTGAAYFTIANRGASDDRLVAAASPVAVKAELHTTIDDGGVMKMRPLAAVDVKAGGKAELKPGGMHLMLIDLKAPLKVGQSFPVTLTFEQAGPIELMVTVEKAGAMSDGAMPGMKM
jgi:copper(I)-binding protein